MSTIHRLAPHDPLPDPSRPHVLVLRRFGEDDPHVVLTEVTATKGIGQSSSGPAVNPDGSPADFEAAITAAERIAARTGIEAIYAIDRTAGQREREILEHGGDHSVGDAALDDDDLEDGVRGSDMRDRKPA